MLFFITEYGKQVKHTFVDCMFGGHLLSTVICEECKHVSTYYTDTSSMQHPLARHSLHVIVHKVKSGFDIRNLNIKSNHCQQQNQPFKNYTLLLK